MASLRAMLLSSCASVIIVAQDSPWTMEGGSSYREGSILYNRAADAAGRARYFYYSLNEGVKLCSKSSPETASATPVYFEGIWIVGDCANQLVGFANPEPLSAEGGKLTPVWTWAPQLSGSSPLVEPRFATPVIDAASRRMYVLLKWESDPQLFGLQLNSGMAAPTLLWTLDLGALDVKNGNGVDATFKTFDEDHAIMLYGSRIWVPSNDFDGALIVNPIDQSYIVTPGQWDDSHRLCGSVGSAALNWTQPVFAVHGSRYGLQGYDPLTGAITVGSVDFNPFSQEFSHPVAVRFQGYDYRFDCVVGSEWDPVGDIFVSAVDSVTMEACGSWSLAGYGIRSRFIANPNWVSAPAVLYDGYQTVFLIYAVILPNGDAPSGRRSAWRSSLVSVQMDQSGPYTDVADVYVMSGVHFNAAPLIIRNAWGPGNHAVAVGSTDGKVHMFAARGFSSGPRFSHDIRTPLPPPVDSTLDNRYLGVSGNYLAATSGGSVAFVAHNAYAEEYWFGIITGAMYPLAPAQPTPAPAAASSSAAAAAVLGTIGGLAVASAGVAFFLPTAGFSVGGTRIVPAAIIKGAAGGVWSALKVAGGGIASIFSRGGAGAAGSLPMTSTYSPSSEAASLLTRK